jgi:hypothetical protein
LTDTSISAKFCRYSGLDVLMRLSIRSIGVLSLRFGGSDLMPAGVSWARY